MKRRAVWAAGVLVTLLVGGAAAIVWRLWQGHALLHAAQSGKVDVVLAAVQRHPRDADLWELLGDAYSARSEYANAVGAYQQSIQLDPGDETSWWLMGNAEVCRANPAGIAAAEVGLRRISTRSADEFARLARQGCCAFGGCRE